MLIPMLTFSHLSFIFINSCKLNVSDDKVLINEKISFER